MEAAGQRLPWRIVHCLRPHHSLWAQPCPCRPFRLHSRGGAPQQGLGLIFASAANKEGFSLMTVCTADQSGESLEGECAP